MCGQELFANNETTAVAELSRKRKSLTMFRKMHSNPRTLKDSKEIVQFSWYQLIFAAEDG